MIQLSDLLQYYKRPEIRMAIVEHAKDKEVAVKFGDKGYGKRPDTLQYPNDILELAKLGCTSFHSSEELWINPLILSPTLKRKELDDARKGWDLLLDIDCPWLKYSQIAADLLIKALSYKGIKNVSVKFSGNHGFHIGVCFESFPENFNGVEIRRLFPEAPRIIAKYLTDLIKSELSRRTLEFEPLDKIAESTGKRFDEIVINGEFDPYQLLEIDTVLISSRHLYRMPYSFNEKSGLVSIPVDPNHIIDFNKDDAMHQKVKVNEFKFLDRTKVIYGEATQLLVDAYDYAEKTKDKNEGQKNIYKKESELPTRKIGLENAPPCIRLMLDGLIDGKKRALFVLLNYFRQIGWSYEDIDKELHEWNKRNEKKGEPLRETILQGALRYHAQNHQNILPPNCLNAAYYVGMNICRPDGLCKTIKNPVNYTTKKDFFDRLSKGEIKSKDAKVRGPMSQEEKVKRREEMQKRKEFKEDVKKRLEKGEFE